MSEKVTDLAEFRRRKELKMTQGSLDKDAESFDADMRRQYDEYVDMMKMLVRTTIGIKMEELYFDCVAEDTVEFRNKDESVIDYIALYTSEFPADYENEDLVINSLINLAPRKIIVRNSKALHQQFLYTIVEIFGDRVEMEIG